MHLSSRLFLLFIPLGIVTLILFIGIRLLQKRPLAHNPSEQPPPAGRPLAALCGLLWLALGVGPTAIVLSSLPHLALSDLGNALAAALLGIPAGLLLLSYAVRGVAPEQLKRWVRSQLGTSPDDPNYP